jgi:bacterioferritin-associated ferredoxin
MPAATRFLVVNDEAQLAEGRARLRERFGDAAYASCTPRGRRVALGLDAAARSRCVVRRRRGPLCDRAPLRSLAALPSPGGARDAPRPRTVCSRVGTTDRQTVEFVGRTGERRLDAVQAALSCGTGCGSCRIEVARLVAQAPYPPERVSG